MHIDEELELKTLVTKEQFEKITSFYQNLKFVEQVNIYYESDKDDSYAFRVRLKDGKQLFTLKAHSNGKIIEYEKYFTSSFELDREILLTLASFSVFPPFKKLGRLITKRAMVINEEAELCFDINEYNGKTDYEIEYEVKKEHDYQAAFETILKQADIQYVPSISKFKRFKATL